MIRTITYRAIGRDFSGPHDTLEALDRAMAYAQGYVEASRTGDRTAKVFLIVPGCLPVEHATVEGI